MTCPLPKDLKQSKLFFSSFKTILSIGVAFSEPTQDNPRAFENRNLILSLLSWCFSNTSGGSSKAL